MRKRLPSLAQPLLFGLMPNLPLLLATTVVPFVLKLLGALAFWVVGGWLIQLAARVLRKALRHSRFDATVAGYLVNITAALLRVMLVVAILGFFGIPTASFAALLAGAGVAIGAAWSGMLGNFAAGVFLQIFRPFSVGDAICAAGVTGTVEEIGMFVTAILGPDHVHNIVPNSKLFGDTIQNFSSHPYRRVDITVQLDHAADVDQVISLIRQGLAGIANQYPGIAADVTVLEINGRGPKLAVRPFTPTSTYYQVLTDTNRMLAQLLSAHGIPVPRWPLELQAEP